MDDAPTSKNAPDGREEGNSSARKLERSGISAFKKRIQGLPIRGTEGNLDQELEQVLTGDQETGEELRPGYYVLVKYTEAACLNLLGAAPCKNEEKPAEKVVMPL